jgi:hypothetical protein
MLGPGGVQFSFDLATVALAGRVSQSGQQRINYKHWKNLDFREGSEISADGFQLFAALDDSFPEIGRPPSFLWSSPLVAGRHISTIDKQTTDKTPPPSLRLKSWRRSGREAPIAA